MVVLKEFQRNLSYMLRSLARILWDNDAPLGGKGCFFLCVSNFLIEVANQAKYCKMIFITSNRKLHPFDNFWKFKTQNTEYDYKYVENYMYKKLNNAVEIYKNQKKNDSILAKVYKVYVVFTPKFGAFRNSFFPLLSIM